MKCQRKSAILIFLSGCTTQSPTLFHEVLCSSIWDRSWTKTWILCLRWRLAILMFVLPVKLLLNYLVYACNNKLNVLTFRWSCCRQIGLKAMKCTWFDWWKKIKTIHCLKAEASVATLNSKLNRIFLRKRRDESQIGPVG